MDQAQLFLLSLHMAFSKSQNVPEYDISKYVQTPGRVWKGKKMSGHMGNETKTIQSLELMGADVQNNLLYVKGAYMYEDKEGVRIIFNNNIQDKIDILPHSLHVWYEFTQPVTEFCEWLLQNVYLMKDTQDWDSN